MIRPAIQLYTLRDLDEPLTKTISRVSETTYDGVEFAGFHDQSPETIATALDDSGLEPVGAHVGLDALESEYDTVVSEYGTVGCDRIVVPSYGADGFESTSAIAETANHLSELADRLADDGFRLSYHNHAYEFEAIEGDSATAYDEFVARKSDSLELEFDVGLARFGGVDPLSYLDRYADDISLVHLTDTVPGDDATLHVDLGEGVLDLDACVRAADDTGAEWLIHENGLTENPAATLESSAIRVGELLDSA